MRCSRICIHLSMTTSISHFLWRLGHFFKETQPSFSRFLDNLFFFSNPAKAKKKKKLSPHPVFNSSKDSPYRCLSLEFSGGKLSGLWLFPTRCHRRPVLRCTLSSTRHLPSVSSVGGSGRGEAAETDERRRGGIRR